MHWRQKAKNVVPTMMNSRVSFRLTSVLLFTFSKWRKGVFTRPFCLLVIKTVRMDSNPWQRESIAAALKAARNRVNLTQFGLATRLGVCLKTLQNWEHGRTKPTKSVWRNVRKLS